MDVALNHVIMNTNTNRLLVVTKLLVAADEKVPATVLVSLESAQVYAAATDGLFDRASLHEDEIPRRDRTAGGLGQVAGKRRD